MNRRLGTIAIGVLCGLLVRLYPELIFPLFLALPYVFLLKALKARRQRNKVWREVCLRQKQQAEKTALPELLEMMVSLQQVAGRGEPSYEALAMLVNFACRLSLCDIYGRVKISMEDPDTRSAYEAYDHPLNGIEVFELPGLRGGQKDRIGRYRFWRTMNLVCFGEVGENNIKPPDFVIPFDSQILTPQACAVLLGLNSHSALYQLIWGNNRGGTIIVVL